MKNIIIKNERNYAVMSGNEISIFDKLPAAIFEVIYIPKRGFSLNEVDNFFKNHEKLYGEVEATVKKVLNTFDVVEGNLGVLFSGPKGLGKSLTVRNICKEALKKGLPVILVKEHFDGISTFIETICQPSVVVFDEFEKLYRNNRKTDKDDLEGQDTLLNLFDSFLNGKKLFMLTCNDLSYLSEYLLNRPGRIHYHFRMHRLSVGEITEYCTDKLNKESHSLIPEICALGTRIPDFSYDMLRSIVFELNTYRCGLDEVKRTLNIDARSKSLFNYTIYFKSGKTEKWFSYIDMASKHQRIHWYEKTNGGDTEYVWVNVSEAKWTGDADGSLLLEGEYIDWSSSKKGNTDHIEKIIFVPGKGGFISSDNDYD